jgi:hypothetical protein
MRTKFLTKELAGFESGMRTERDSIRHFINTHAEQGVEITVEDIKQELESRDKFETKQIVDGIMERWND